MGEVLNMNHVSAGVVIAYCDKCKKEVNRVYLCNDSDHYKAKCTCGNDAKLITVSRSEMEMYLRELPNM